MALPYWISKENNKYYLHFKVSQPAGSKRQYTIAKDSSYSPTVAENFWTFFDDFSGASLDDSKWDDTNAASYSVSDSKLNMWGNWGGCCSGSCYYDGIRSVQTFDLPLLVRVAQNQDPYKAASGCGKTGVSIGYDGVIQIVPSTDTNDKRGLTVRVNNTAYSNLNVQRMPNIAPDNFGFSANFGTGEIEIFAYWDDIKGDFVVSTAPNTTTGKVLVISGDTDATNVIDHLDYIAVAPSKPRMPKLTVISQTDTSVIVEVDDSDTNDGVALSDLVVTLDLTSFIGSLTEGLNIYSSNVFILFENPNDNKVYSWDGSSWNSLNKTVSDLTASDFETYGSLNIVNINKTQWEFLANELNVLAYTDKEIASADVSVKFQPKDRLVGQKERINLSDYTIIRNLVVTETGTPNDSEPAFYTLISRDNQNWYKWDGNSFVFVGNRSIDINNPDDLAWVKNNGVNISNYEGAGVDDWNGFFDNQHPDQLYFVFAINYDSLSSTAALDKIEIVADVDEYWFDDTKSHEIRYTPSTISIKFSASGKYKVNYVD